MTQKLYPLHDYIFVEVDKGPRKSAGGIFAPETTKERLHLAKVLRVGPGTYKDGVWISLAHIQPGQTLLIGAYDEIKLEDFTTCGMVKYSNNVIGIMAEEDGDGRADLHTMPDRTEEDAANVPF